MNIKEIQEWEKDFSKRKGLSSNDPEQDMIAGFLKLSEEIGELSEAILQKKYEEIPVEVSDVIIFACKIAKISEDHYGQPSLSDELKKKIKYSEERNYDKYSGKLDKPKGGFKKWDSEKK